VACMGDRAGACRVFVGRPEEKSHLEGTELDGGIILKRIFKKCDGGMEWIYLSQDREGTCECGNEPSDSVKCGKFLDWLRNC